MQKQKNIQLIVIGVLAFSVLFMSIGFAAYSQVLNINGMATIGSGNRWSVHFNSNSYQLGEGSVEENSKSITDNSIAYNVTLNNPGDFYLFQIDVVNDGQINAVLDSIYMSELSAEESNHITYEVDYDDLELYASEDNISAALPYATGVNRKVVKVRVSYDELDEGEQPLAEPIELNLSASLNFSQSQ